MAEDLTTRRCRSEVLAFSERVAAFYEKAFKEPADEQFWIDVDELDAQLGERLRVRPLGAMAITAALREFGVAFKAKAKDALERGRRAGATATQGGT